MARELKGYALKNRQGLVPHQYDKSAKSYGRVVHASSVDIRTAVDAAKARTTTGFPGPIMRVMIMEPKRGGGYNHIARKGYDNAVEV